MINFKKIGILGISVLSAFAFASKVSADPRWHDTSLKGDGTDLRMIQYYGCPTDEEPNKQCDYEISAYIETKYEEGQETDKGEVRNLHAFYDAMYQGLPTSDVRKTFSIGIEGLDLEATKEYEAIYEYKDENYVVKKTYTGAELESGVTFSIDKTYGKGVFKIVDKATNTPIVYNKHLGQALETIEIDFSEHYKDIIDYFNKLAPNGVLKIDALPYQEGEDKEFLDSKITAAVDKLVSADYKGQGNCDVDKDICTLTIYKEDENGEYLYGQSFKIKYEFAKKTAEGEARVKEVADKLTTTHEDLNDSYDNWFILQDMENINYIYNSQQTKKFFSTQMPNYSSQIHALSDDNKIDFAFDIRAGGDVHFYEAVLGPMNISYDDVIYTNHDPVGFLRYNILYVPSNIDKTDEAFINYTKTRIENYLTGVNISLKVGGKISDIANEEDYKYCFYDFATGTFDCKEYFSVDKTTGSWYLLKIGEVEYKFMIAQDETKMNVPYVKTVDRLTKVRVETDVAAVPLDTKVNVIHLNPDSEEYKRVAKHVNIINGLAYDIKLYSTSLGMKIDKLQNGTFKVYIPLPNEYKNKKLFATYVNENGKVEFHEVKYEHGYGVFTTDHFSVYAITEMNNPSTGDNVLSNLIILGLSAGAIIILNKKFFFSK